ncbi:MAG TPA: NAD(P)/FAD-dependent oxidoreductase, partial [Candidatus Udaeobacter sp.]|nr:NAD(P)/FAD-dependent oxidoreductase [Candidatus Udaeobacter sp.]
MQTFDVAIVGGGPAGSSCAAFCSLAGLHTLVVERERFPREKVCGDCLNPSCWPVLERLGLTQRVWDLTHSKLTSVEFIAIDGHKVIVDFPTGEDCELSIKRSLFDDLLLKRACDLGVHVREETTVTALKHCNSEKSCSHGPVARPVLCAPQESGYKVFQPGWKIETNSGESFLARVLVGADGRNSTVARLRNLLPRPARERVALQAHIPLPRNFGKRIVLQFLREGYSGQAPVNEIELNLCLVGRPPTISRLRQWAQRHFEIPADQPWRTITPLTRAPVPCANENLLFIGDAARVVEPFTGEGIYYALRSGELAAAAIAKIISGKDRQFAFREFARASAEMYQGRLWINRLARAAVLSPRIGSLFVRAARINPSILKLLTTKI